MTGRRYSGQGFGQRYHVYICGKAGVFNARCIVPTVKHDGDSFMRFHLWKQDWQLSENLFVSESFITSDVYHPDT